MPISNTTIKNQINSAINTTKVLEQEQAQEQFAQLMANIIEAAIKSATVTIASGAIITVGSATTQTNTAPVAGTLS